MAYITGELQNSQTVQGCICTSKPTTVNSNAMQEGSWRL